ncbi:diaminopimelate epimerase [Ancylobacter vacuolatus]|uniref:Diaminopimelate epimerase n=1 Tax=Ancylobacter vacuolatus TaxID=223389 RepID=A0ABU0DDD7_9HYPH|nr:diaminopimelate epimerase [Ancylobacter vacuolatus]MDQ0346424.1 diaminopimelate epimerase [Ancylobacter vacuolatus]
MAALENRPFVKMNGLGNEIVVLDLRDAPLMVPPEEARALARDGVLPFDQIMALYPPQSEGTHAFVRIINADGSESGACGNGTRCIALYEAGRTGADHLVFESVAGPLDCTLAPEGITVDMGVPRFGWHDIPLAGPVADTRAIELQAGPAEAPVLRAPAVVNVGNPHAIFWVDDVNAVDLAQFGPELEHHPIFPERANISVVQIVSPEHIILRVWERGVGLTRACGTGACAAAVCAARLGLTGRRVTVTLPGGDLVIDWRESDDHMLMTGPAEIEFDGRLTAAMLGDAEPTAARPGAGAE